MAHPDLLGARLVDSAAVDVALAGARAREDAVSSKDDVHAHVWRREARKGDVARLDALPRRRDLLCASFAVQKDGDDGP